MQLQVITTPEQLAPLAESWRALHTAADAGPFQHPAWVQHSYALLPRGDMVLIAVFAASRQLVGVFPFAIEPLRIKGLRYRALVHGCSPITDYAQFLVHPDFNARVMIKRVLACISELQQDRWDFIKIENLSDEDGTAKLFAQFATQRFYGATVAEQITPLIDFSRQFEESKKLANIRRRFRDLTDSTRIRLLKGSEIKREHLQEFCRIQAQTFPDAAFHRESTQRFVEALLDDDDFSGRVELAILEQGDRMIAAHFGFFDAQRYYYYVPTFDREFSDQGPGQHLLMWLVDHAKEKKLKNFDLLRGGERYKFDWTNHIASNFTLFAAPEHASRWRRLLVNLWLVTRALPLYLR